MFDYGLNFGIKDAVDVLMLAILMYYCYTIMKRSRSVYIFYGIMLFVCFWILVKMVFAMSLMSAILDQVLNVGAITMVVLFQDDIRRFFFSLGTHQRVRQLRQLIGGQSEAPEAQMRHPRHVVLPILMACINMSKNKVGALIVIQNDIPLDDLEYTGERINAIVGQRLIENIFFKNSPLHDGAMIISHERITAAACILPVSNELDIPKHFGLRHRAAHGVSQRTDALAVVVSEETGHITVVHNSRFVSPVKPDELERVLVQGGF